MEKLVLSLSLSFFLSSFFFVLVMARGAGSGRRNTFDSHSLEFLSVFFSYFYISPPLLQGGGPPSNPPSSTTTRRILRHWNADDLSTYSVTQLVYTRRKLQVAHSGSVTACRWWNPDASPPHPSLSSFYSIFFFPSRFSSPLFLFVSSSVMDIYLAVHQHEISLIFPSALYCSLTHPIFCLLNIQSFFVYSPPHTHPKLFRMRYGHEG